MKKSSLNHYGETELISSFQKWLKSKKKEVICGIGDDTAVIKIKGSKNYLLFTTDMMVEDVHFKLSWTSPSALGEKILAINISDISAMGGYPTYAIISLGLRPDLPVNFVEKLYQGLKEMSSKYSVEIIGGDTTQSKKLILSIALLGEVEKKNLIKRDGAKPQDLIFVSGTLGDAAAGLYLLKENIKLPANLKPLAKRLINKHLRPLPQFELSRFLINNLNLNSMIDVSDGLSTDILHIAKRSKVGMQIYTDKIPISTGVKKIAKYLKISPVDLALSGGEDYQLVWTMSKKEMKKWESLRRLSERGVGEVKLKITPIGEVKSSSSSYLVFPDGKKEILLPSGFDHFKPKIPSLPIYNYTITNVLYRGRRE